MRDELVGERPGAVEALARLWQVCLSKARSGWNLVKSKSLTSRVACRRHCTCLALSRGRVQSS